MIKMKTKPEIKEETKPRITEEIEHIPSALELFCTYSVNAIDAATHPGNPTYRLNGEIERLKPRYFSYLQRIGDAENSEAGIGEGEEEDDDSYVEKNIDANDNYIGLDEIDKCLDKIDLPESVANLYAFLENSERRLDVKVEKDRLTLVSLVRLKVEFKEIF